LGVALIRASPGSPDMVKKIDYLRPVVYRIGMVKEVD